MATLAIDAFDFCRHKERREGEVEVRTLARLSQELVDSAGDLRWALQGDIDKLGHFRLQLSVAGCVQLMCQRCLSPLAFSLDSHSTLVLAKDEAAADELEQSLADDTLDVIVGSASLNLIMLIEDEALLALPLAPRHTICPDHATLVKGADAKAASPFAALQKLKEK